MFLIYRNFIYKQLHENASLLVSHALMVIKDYKNTFLGIHHVSLSYKTDGLFEKEFHCLQSTPVILVWLCYNIK